MMASAEYGVRYRVAKKNGEIEVRERIVATRKALDRFVAALEEKENFIDILAWSDPTPGSDGAVG